MESERPADNIPPVAVISAKSPTNSGRSSSSGRTRKVSRYSVSFQDRVTEVTPLLAEVGVLRRVGGSLRNLRRDDDGDSDEEFSECEGAGIVCHSRPTSSLGPNNDMGSINCQENPDEVTGNRSFSDGAAILQYTSQGDGPANPMRFCTHGNRYETCCGKDTNTAIPNGHNSENGAVKESGHCHSSSERAVDKKARRRLLLASALCLVFMVGEIVGGYFAGSLAIMTDAAHLLTDFASFMISLFSLYVATRPATKRMSFGWYRAEVIGALTSVIMIWVVTGILVYMAVERIVHKDYEIDALIMLITSGVGVFVNILMALTLHPHGHSPGQSHGHSHGGHSHSKNDEHGHSHNGSGVGVNESDTRVAEQHEESGASPVSQHQENINVRAAYIHVIGDFIQSVGVFLAALTIYFKNDWKIVDPICTFLFSILVLLTTFAIMKDTLTVLMEGLPKGVDFNDVHKTFFSIQGVVQVHNLRIWSLSMDKVALSAHVVINPGINPRDILKEASRIVRDKYSFFEMTLQIEDMKEEMANCEECLGPAT